MWPVTQSYQAWRQIPLKRVLSSCQRLCERCSFSRGSEKGSGCIVIYAYNEISGWFLSSSEGSPATPGMKCYSFARLLMYTSDLCSLLLLSWLGLSRSVCMFVSLASLWAGSHVLSLCRKVLKTVSSLSATIPVISRKENSIHGHIHQ